MKFKFQLPALALILFLTIGYACNYPCIASSAIATTDAPGADVREKKAAYIAANLAKKDFAAVRKDFAKIMLDALSEAKLQATWEDAEKKFGAFQKVISTENQAKSGIQIVRKRCQFAGENATIQVAFNEENQVIGLYILP